MFSFSQMSDGKTPTNGCETTNECGTSKDNACDGDEPDQQPKEFAVDRSKISQTLLADQLPLLAEIGVAAYDQQTFEEGVLDQVDEALRKSTTKKLLNSCTDETSDLNRRDPLDVPNRSSSFPSNKDLDTQLDIRPVEILTNGDFRNLKFLELSSKRAISRKNLEEKESEDDGGENGGQSGSDYVPSEDEDEEENDRDDEFISDEELPSTSTDIKVKKGKKKKAVRGNRGKQEEFASLRHLKDDGSESYYRNRIKEWKAKLLHDRLVKAAQESNDDSSTSVDSEEVVELTDGLKIPTSLWDRLYPYQKTGVRWLWDLHCQAVGGIIGDEMGLGKTIQIIVFLASLDYSRLPILTTGQIGLGSVLIVCPTTVMHQWVREFHHWWPPARVVVLHESSCYTGSRASLVRQVAANGGVLVTSYSTMTLERELLQKYDWHYVILDEGHKIRNPDARVTVTAKRFRTPHRIILSGTPMQNSLKELWSLFDFVFPGRLGALPVFLREFGVPITQGGYANATEIQVRTAYRCACVLRDLISPYLLRRMKADVQQAVHLPSKNEQVLFCRLTDEQRSLYRQYLESRECESILKGGLEVFVGLIALRKLCNHPDLITGGPNRCGEMDEQEVPSAVYGYPGRSGKLTVVEALLKLWRAQGHRALLFSQSKQMLDILEKFLRNQGYTYLRMDGGTPIGSRQRLVETYNNDPELFVFLLTTRVGGLGLNLIGADRVLIYDPDWNPSTDAQARERVWRIGQKKPVTVYRLLTTGTIEEKIYHRQIFKQFLTNRVLKDPRQRRFFKTNDLYELFTLTDDQVASGTESGSLFAGTGSEISKESSKKKKKRQRNENIFDQLSEEKNQVTKRVKLGSAAAVSGSKGHMNPVDEDDIDFVPESTKEESRQLSKERQKQLRQLAQQLSRRLGSRDQNPAIDDTVKGSSLPTDRLIKRSRRKDKKLEGVKIPSLDSKADYRPPRCGVDEVEDDTGEKTSRKHDSYVLKKLFKKSGIQSALRHDKIVNDSESCNVLVEAEAESVAKQAAEALEASRRLIQSSSDYGIVTWTGRQGEAGRMGNERPRFGPKAKKRNNRTSEPDPAPPTTPDRPLFSGLDRSSQSKDLSSSELLTVIRNRRRIDEIQPNNDGGSQGSSSGNDPVPPRFEHIMSELRLFLVLGGKNADGRATTAEILAKFGSRIPSQDSAVFRAMLKRICDFHRGPGGEGVWSLKTQFR